MEYHEVSWRSIRLHKVPWYAIVLLYHEVPRGAMRCHEVPVRAMRYHANSIMAVLSHPHDSSTTILWWWQSYVSPIHGSPMDVPWTSHDIAIFTVPSRSHGSTMAAI